MGRPPKVFDPDMIYTLASIGATQEETARVLGCSVDTIQRRYLDDYNDGLANIKTSLRRQQVKLALAGNVTMLIWLGKNLLDQSDKAELTGKDGAPLMPETDREELLGKLIGSGPAPPADRVQ